jgi:thiol-disulfide isomerase/thioredoxin
MRRLLALGLVAGIALVACGSSDKTTEPEGAAGGGTAVALLPKDRLSLPEYDLERFRALLDELRGTPVVVNIWGSWCPPCRVEAPDLSTVAHEFEEQVQFLGVDILDSREGARAFILEFDWPYPSVFDPDGEIRDGLGYLGQPITFIVDRDGDVVFEWNGAIGEEMLRKEIRKVL